MVMNISAIIVAAGKSKRIAGKVHKPYILIRSKPILLYTLKRIVNCRYINRVIVVINRGDIKRCKKLLNMLNTEKPVDIVCGGKKRQDSVWNGIKILDDNTDYVLVHDGCRPFINSRLLKRCIEKVKRHKAVIVALPVKETVKRIDALSQGKNSTRFVSATLDRQRLWLAQTPQVFNYRMLLDAYRKSLEEKTYFTDDASVVERYGNKVVIVKGYEENIKITTPLDLTIAKEFVKKWT